MKRYIFSLLLVCCVLFAATGCGKADPSKSPADPPAAEEPAVPPQSAPAPGPAPEPEYIPSGINPLTGLPMEPVYENNRPIAIMFNNVKVSQPQLGISQADIIYEIPAEGGITRMLGLFQTLDGVGDLGSIRSTRSYYLDTALGHDAILVHAGGSPDAYDDISTLGMANLDGVRGGPSHDAAFWRDAERRKNAGYEHSLLTSGENIQAFLSHSKYRTTHKDGYSYSQSFVEDGTPMFGNSAAQIKLVYSYYKTGIFSYNADSKLYEIQQYGKDYIDGNSGQQVGVTNLLLLETDISDIPGDTSGRLDVRMTGEGMGTYFCGGKFIPIIWRKSDRSSPFVYRTSDGAPLSLGQGTSYICIYNPESSNVYITD